MGIEPALREFCHQKEDSMPNEDRDNTPSRRYLRLLCDAIALNAKTPTVPRRARSILLFLMLFSPDGQVISRSFKIS